MKRVIWLLLIGTMIAFHNTHKQEFKSIDEIGVVIEEEDEEN